MSNPRRDWLYAMATRGEKLSPRQSHAAWAYLIARLHTLSSKDIPKFRDLACAIEDAISVGDSKQPDDGLIRGD